VPLAGIVGAGMPEPIVLVPIELGPIGGLLASDDEGLYGSLEGAAIGAGAGPITASSTFLLQALKATIPASASDRVAIALKRVINIRFSS
jgi:hypothetical protein